MLKKRQLYSTGHGDSRVTGLARHTQHLGQASLQQAQVQGYWLIMRQPQPHAHLGHTITKSPLAKYCDSPQLTNCQESQAGSFTYPAKVRWCKATAASGTTPARTAEQNATTAQPAAGLVKLRGRMVFMTRFATQASFLNLPQLL